MTIGDWGRNFSGVWFQSYCAVVHFASALILLIYTSTKPDVGKIQLYIIEATFVEELDEMFTFSLAPYGKASIFLLLFFFSIITSGFHVYYIISDPAKDPQQYRMIEYSITASIMGFVIAVLIGIVDVISLVCIVGLMNACMLFGYVQELTDGESFQRYLISPLVLGWAPYIIAWGVMLGQFASNVSRSDTAGEVPWFVYMIVVLEVILFSCFAVVQFFYDYLPKLRGGYTPLGDDTKNDMYGWYHLLSFVAKMVLVWFAFGGIVGRDGDKN